MKHESMMYRLIRRGDEEAMQWMQNALAARLDHGFDSPEFAKQAQLGIDQKFWGEWVKDYFPETFSKNSVQLRAAANHTASVGMVKALLSEGQDDGVQALLAAGVITEEQIEEAQSPTRVRRSRR